MLTPEKVSVISERIQHLSDLNLHNGGHSSFESGHCAMELVSWLVDERFSDTPKCVSLAIARLMRSWNDSFNDHVLRTEVLKPLLVCTIGTATTYEDEETRAMMCVDWLYRVHTPAMLRVAGQLDHAVELEALPALTRADVTPPGLQRVVQRFRESIYKSMLILPDAWSDTAVTPVYHGASTGQCSAIRDAVWRGSAAVADHLGREGLIIGQDVVKALQASAQDLVRRMCAVGRPE